MDRITPEFTVETYAEWLAEIGFKTEINDGLITATRGEAVVVFVHLLPSKNLIFRVPFVVKKEVDELALLKEINSLNIAALSGSFSVDDDHFTFLFSLIKPFGMGKAGFKIFVDYNLNLLAYMLAKSNTKEFLE